MFSIFKRSRRKRAWNKGKLMGQKPPPKPKEIWSIRGKVSAPVAQTKNCT